MYPVQLKDDLLFPLEQTFNKFFEDFFNNKSNLNYTKSNQGYPKLNCFVVDNNFNIVFAVPGMVEEDIDLEFNEDNSVTIRGRMSSDHKSKNNAVYYYRELRQSQFERTVKLPSDVKGPPTKACLSSGLLTLTWNLKPIERKEKKKITIEKK